MLSEAQLGGILLYSLPECCKKRDQITNILLYSVSEHLPALVAPVKKFQLFTLHYSVNVSESIQNTIQPIHHRSVNEVENTVHHSQKAKNFRNENLNLQKEQLHFTTVFNIAREKN
jgi:hypothetical protein